MKRIVAFAVFVFSVVTTTAQAVEVYPSNWWVGMKMNKIQLMLYSQDGIDN